MAGGLVAIARPRAPLSMEGGGETLNDKAPVPPCLPAADRVAAELGNEARILRRWERDGRVPEPAVDGRGTRVGALGSAVRILEGLRVREAADRAAMEAEGLLLRETARRMLRIGTRQLQERVSEGALVLVERLVVECRGGRWGLWTVQGYARGRLRGWWGSGGAPLRLQGGGRPKGQGKVVSGVTRDHHEDAICSFISRRDARGIHGVVRGRPPHIHRSHVRWDG